MSVFRDFSCMIKCAAMAFFVLFATNSAFAACTNTQIDVNGDGTNCVTAPFRITTTSSTDTFSFTLSPQGTFYVDCGTGGTLSSSGYDVSDKTITRNTNTTEATYTCSYSSAGVRTIKFASLVSSNEPIYYANMLNGENTGVKSAIKFTTPTAIASLSTSCINSNCGLAAIFPTKPGNDEPQPSFWQTFDGATNLTSIPENLFAGLTGAPSINMFNYTFNGCTSLNNVPINLFSGLSGAAKNRSFYNTFAGCTGFTKFSTGQTYVPVAFVENITVGGMYTAQGMFSDTNLYCREGCTSFAECCDIDTDPDCACDQCPAGTSRAMNGTNWLFADAGRAICQYNNYTITLEDGPQIYTTYNTNVYLDSARTKAMTTSANAIAKPRYSGWTFAGYYDIDEASGGTQYIANTGRITTAGLTAGKNLTEDTTWYVRWAKCPAGSFCTGDYDDDEIQTCTSATNGEYTRSDAGAESIDDCYRACTNADVANSSGTVNGGVYYQNDNRCVATACASGYELNNGTCVLSTYHCDAGKYYQGATQTCQTCPDAKYCPGGDFVINNTDQGINDCPAVTDARKMTSDYPDAWLPDENMEIFAVSFTGWATGKKAITECQVVYKGKNNRGIFNNERILYNSSTNKYDNVSGDTFYNQINPGYYGSERLYGTTCPSNQKMRYKTILPCPAGSYCPGFVNANQTAVAMPPCTSTDYTYDETIGIYACPNGYGNSAAKSASSSACYTSCSVANSGITNAVSVTGNYYYENNASNCRVTSCNTGYAPNASNTACVANTYTVTLNANNGTGGTPSVTATYNAAMPSATMPTRAGYTFAGYYDTNAATGGTQYYTAAGASARTWDKTAATILYARWSACGQYKYCGNGTEENCPVNHYCEGGDAFPCPAGKVCVDGQQADCPANSYCTGGTAKSCSSLGDGTYTKSDTNSDEMTDCWKSCAMAEHAQTMSGRDYYGNGTDTCVPSACVTPGYHLSGSVCVANQITINFADSGSKTVSFGGDIETPAAPVKPGYVFKGWRF